MRNPLRSEAEAFRFLGVVIVGALVIAAAAWLNTWVGVAAAVLVVAALVRWVRNGPTRADAVAHLGDVDAEVRLDLPRPFAVVEPPALALVEAAGARIVLEHPEDRLEEAAAAQRRQRVPHQRRPGAAAPGLRQRVDGVELPSPGSSPAGPVDAKATTVPVLLGDEHVLLALPLRQRPLPAEPPPLRIERRSAARPRRRARTPPATCARAPPRSRRRPPDAPAVPARTTCRRWTRRTSPRRRSARASACP